jgi:hypothetical protein
MEVKITDMEVQIDDMESRISDIEVHIANMEAVCPAMDGLVKRTGGGNDKPVSSRGSLCHKPRKAPDAAAADAGQVWRTAV